MPIWILRHRGDLHYLPHRWGLRFQEMKQLGDRVFWPPGLGLSLHHYLCLYCPFHLTIAGVKSVGSQRTGRAGGLE